MSKRELVIKWVVREDDSNIPYNKVLRGPADAVSYFHTWADEAQEVLIALFVDNRMRVLGHKEVSRGTASHCIMDATTIFRAALMAGAMAVIVAHNHPSGSILPSPEDIVATKELCSIGEVVKISVLDSIIFGLDNDGNMVSHSMKSAGEM